MTHASLTEPRVLHACIIRYPLTLTPPFSFPFPLILFFSISRGKLPDKEEILVKDDLVKLKRCIYATQRSGLPPIVTHNMLDDGTDPILNHIRRTQLFNHRTDKVKVSHGRSDSRS